MNTHEHVVATTNWWDDAVQMANDASTMTNLRHRVVHGVVAAWRVVRTEEPIGLPSLHRFIDQVECPPMPGPVQSTTRDIEPTEVCS